MTMFIPVFEHPYRSEWATLLPSPTKANFQPGQPPFLLINRKKIGQPLAGVGIIRQAR